MVRWLIIAWILVLVAGPVAGERLPIRIDSDRDGSVEIKVVGEEGRFRHLSEHTPAVVEVDPGQRIDIKVRAVEGFWQWSGSRQSVSGPSNITIRLERSLAWSRVSLAAAFAALVVTAFLWRWRRRTGATLRAIEKRARRAESGRGLPTRIGAYRIREQLGEGAMAYIYRGQDAHGMEYAIKVPKTADARFVRECNISTSLQSPNIVRGFDFQAEPSDDDPPYLVQELLQGETLQQRLTRGSGLGLSEIATIFGDVLDGLGVAHEHDVLHRDLKPENIFLHTRAGQRETAVLVDFGVALAEDSLDLTRGGETVGTALYASPEQTSADSPLDARSDLYSAGVVLWEMLAGDRLWKVQDRLDLVRAQQAGPPCRINEIRPDTPPAWEELLAALLQPKPAHRPTGVPEVKERFRAGLVPPQA